MTESRLATARSALLPALAIAAFCLLAFEFFGPLRIARDWVGDLRLASLSPVYPQNEDIVVLTITEETLERFPYRAPIDRGFIAGLVETLQRKADIKVLGIDLLFDQPTTPRDDARLRQALLEATFPVVVASGDKRVGLTDRQLDFQQHYLRGIRSGSAVLRSQDGVIRNYWPYGPDGTESSFSRALGQAVGLDPPDEPRPVLFIKRTDDGLAPIRQFPAHTLQLLPADWLRNKAVLLGTALPNQDQHRTPLSVLGGNYETMPGVLVHAQMLAQMMTGETPPRTTPGMLVATVLVATLAGLAAPLMPVQPGWRLALGIVLVPLCWLAVLNRPVFWNLPLPVLEPAAAYILTAAFTLALDRRKEQRQKRFMHDALIHYVPEQVVDDLVAHPEKLRLGGEKREMSFLFTDVADFSGMTEFFPPEQLVSLMTRYLEGLMEVTLQRGGAIARLAGDGLLVFFGAPDLQPDHARRAVECAIDMDRYCENFRATLAAEGVTFGVTRIGVHSGPAVVGNVGGSKRFEYTAYGETINTAARLESLNQHLGTRVCFSAASLAGQDPGLFRPVGNVQLKGMSHGIGVFTLWDTLSEPEQRLCLEIFQRIKSGSDPIESDLVATSERLPRDTLMAFYLDRVRTGEPPTDIVMREK